jgi:peptidoglycan/LPS O-acetylase OafA/YrhL
VGTRGVSARLFLARRLSRLYPVIVVSLGASLGSWWLLHSPLGGYVGPPRSVIYNLLGIQSWFFNEPTIRQSWDGVTWSLSCELFFYACSPLLLTWIARLRRNACVLLLCGAFVADAVAQLISHPTTGSLAQNFFYFFPPARLVEFAMGALACQSLIGGLRVPFRSVWITFSVTTIVPLIIYCHLVQSSHQYLTITGLVVTPGFIATIFVTASRDALRRPKSKQLLRTRQMVWLGDVSYSYYMVHVLVLGGLGMVFSNFKVSITSVWLGSLWLVGYLGLALLTAWIVWRFVERPGQKGMLFLLAGLSRKQTPGLDDVGGTDARGPRRGEALN